MSENKELYIALIKSTYYVEGDVRSKSNPGHGYPGGTEMRTEVREFDDKEEMLEWVRQQEDRKFGKESYRILKCTPMEVKTTISVEVEAKP